MPAAWRKTAEIGRTHAERWREAETRIGQAAYEVVVRRSVDQTLAEAGEEAGYNRECERNVLAHGGVDLLLAAIAFNLDDSRGCPKKLRVSRGYVRSVVEGGLTKAAAALQFNVSAKTVAKWVKRFRAGDVDGLPDRSSRPHSLPSQTLAATCAEVETLRR